MILLRTAFAGPDPVGRLTLFASGAGLRAVLFEGDLDGRRVPIPSSQPGDHAVLDRAVEQLSQYFDGTRRRFDLPLDPVGTTFQRRAWAALAEIPYGQTASYGRQATMLGNPRASRAVGAANGRNPLSIVLPCHRVVGSDGRLTGFGGGLAAKAWLLEHERRHRRAAQPFDAAPQ